MQISGNLVICDVRKNLLIVYFVTQSSLLLVISYIPIYSRTYKLSITNKCELKLSAENLIL